MEEELFISKEAEIRILNQLIAAQSILPIFSEADKIGEFTVQAFKSIPGVILCSICFQNHKEIIGDIFEASKKIMNWIPAAQNVDPAIIIEELLKDSNLIITPIRTIDESFGFVLISIASEQNFAKFYPSVSNFINVAAIHLENNKQRKQVKIYQEHLEEEVKKQTADLLAEVNEHRMTSKALLASDKKLSFFLENSPIAIIEWNADFIITRWSGFAEKIFGWNYKETIGKSLYEMDMIFEQDKPYAQDIVEQLTFSSNYQVISDNRNYRKDGSVIHCTWYNTVLRDNAGKMLSVLSQVLDITDKLNAERAVIESEKKFKDLFSQSPVAIELYNVDGELIDCNQACLTLFGIKDISAVKGFKLFDDPNISEYQKQEIRSGERVRYTLEFDFEKVKKLNLYNTTKSGIYYFECLVTSFSADQDINKFYILHLVDITERRKKELIIQQQNEKLQELNATKDKFFSIVAHDLKSPFQGFLGLTKAMAEEGESFGTEEIKNLGINMYQTAKNIYNLIENLLAWARMQQDSTKFQPKELLLSNMIEEIVEILQKRCEQKEITIVSSASAAIKAFGDEQMVNSIILNLLANAVKYTSKNGIVTIKLRQDKNQMVKISISDTGIGMDKSLIEKLFKIGEKVGRVGTDGETSSGLGLLLCKEFVSKNGGELSVVSEVGVGSTFSFTLPGKEIVA